MAHHVCSRESCPTINVNGPKSTCIKCKKICYLMCFGAEKSTTGMIRFKLQNEMTVYVETTNAQIACGVCVLEGNVTVQTKMQMAQKPEVKECVADEPTNAELMEALKTGIVEIKEHINANVEKNQIEVKQYMNEMTETVKKASIGNDQVNGTFSRQPYSAVLQNKRKILFATPVSNKRRRSDDSASEVQHDENKAINN